MQPFHRLDKTALEMGVEQCQPYIDFPKRPTWSYDMNKEQVERQEEEAFQAWKQAIYEKYGDNQQNGSRQLSWFEQNLEVWRQLWRVLEISDVILLVIDIRNPMIHFPLALYHYVTKDLKRKMVGVFNKIDLVSEFTLFSWQKYFEEQFPELHLATFSCFPMDEKLIDDTATYALKTRVKRPRKRYYSAQGVQSVLRCCKDVKIEKHGVNVDWHGLIQRYDDKAPMSDHDTVDGGDHFIDDDDDSDTSSTAGLDEFSGILDISQQNITPHQDYVTIGLVGHPNVGKSSLINSIMHRTVVSTSRTPGHTKHFQTIHLCENVRLCDSPGLVFPSLLPRSLQILSGMYPIAQVQEPYSVIQYMAERIPLEKILSLTPPDLDNARNFKWSAWVICEAYAEQRGFYTAKAARPDAYRAANAILQLATDGRILLSFKPPGFFNTTKYEKLKIKEVDARQNSQDSLDDSESDDDDSNNGGGAVTTTDGQYALLALVDE
ncbi:P-loop containing nucleoside triphosphate hydrolase protein [Absidia repens]|uniref:Guanine nucleotide-binding protein-like 1 n=1 Tax=Absidia repens TaxID=90262 RepID=A0A1X2IQD9_9FUNG|nr:P-loop containing nucleoside triphosphate hydrolase protein [Absidia repens]